MRQPPILEDIDLGAFQHGDVSHPVVELIDRLPLAREAVRVETAHDAQMLGVVGDRDVGELARASRGDHLLQRAVALGSIGVHVQVSLEIGALDEDG